MRKLVKEKAVRFIWKLTCVECGRKANYYIGYDFESDDDVDKHMHGCLGWNGWLLDKTEVCPMCLYKNYKGKYDKIELN